MNEPLKQQEQLAAVSLTKIPAQYREDPYRFVVFILYAFLNFLMGTFMNSFVAIQKQIQIAFHKKTREVFFTSSLFLLGNISLGLFVYPLFKKLGFRKLMILSSFILLIGNLLRTAIHYSFYSVLAGQFLIGAAACLIVNVQMEFCFIWFHPDKRPLYISLISVSNIFGGGLGNLIPQLFVFSQQQEIITQQINFYLVFFSTASFILFIFVLNMFADKPRQNYGFIYQIDQDQNENQLNIFSVYYQHTKQAFSSILFFIFLLIYTFTNSNLILMGTVINRLVESYGFQPRVGGMCAFTVIFFGLISAIVFSLFLMGGEKFRLKLSVCTILSMISLGLTFYGLQNKNLILVVFTCGLFGLSYFPICSSILEIITRKFVELPLYLVNTILFMTSQIFTVILQTVSGNIIEKYQDKFGLYIILGIIGITLISTILIQFVDCEYKIDKKKPS